jgi:hypothetical protein
MQSLHLSDHRVINFVWALPDELSEVWNLEETSGTTWAHPKPFFGESLLFERLLLARDGETPVAYLIYEVIWGNTASLSLLKVLPGLSTRLSGSEAPTKPISKIYPTHSTACGTIMRLLL